MSKFSLLGYYINKSPYLFQKGVTYLTAYLFALDWKMLLPIICLCVSASMCMPYLFENGVTCLTTYLIALDWNMLLSSPYLFEKGVTCLTTYLFALDWNMLLSSPYLFEKGVTCLTTYLFALDWNILLPIICLSLSASMCMPYLLRTVWPTWRGIWWRWTDI